VVPSGSGLASLKNKFAGSEVDVDIGIEVLLELDMVEKDAKRSVYVAVDPVTREQASRNAQSDFLINRYQASRTALGLQPRAIGDKDKKKFVEMLAWVTEHKVNFDAYLEYVYEIFRDIEPVKVIEPGHVCGPYARTKWLNRGDHEANAAQPAKAAHAGSVYRPTKAIRRELIEAGINVDHFSQAELRYIDDQAEVFDEDTPLSDKFKRAVMVVHRNKHHASRA